MGSLSTLTTLAAAGLGLGAACLSYGVLVEGTDYRLRHVQVPVLPAGAESIRLLHVSDIHARPGQHKKFAFLRELASLEPDIVIDTGDNLSSANVVPELAEALEPLLRRPGGIVFGSNDYFGPVFKNPFKYVRGEHRHAEPGVLPSDELRGALTAHGWHWLEGVHVTIDVRGTVVELRGTGDAHIDRSQWGTIAGPRGDGVDVSIGVSHAPYLHVVESAAADDVDLLLCGHTHGGQVCVPTPWGPTEGRALTTNCDLDAARVKGLSVEPREDGRDALYLHVSAGLGMSPFAPYRFACPPEASLLELVRR